MKRVSGCCYHFMGETASSFEDKRVFVLNEMVIVSNWELEEHIQPSQLSILIEINVGATILFQRKSNFNIESLKNKLNSRRSKDKELKIERYLSN